MNARTALSILDAERYLGMNDPIPAVKLPPELVPKICRIFIERSSNPEQLKTEVISCIRSNSVRVRPPSDKNAFRAVTLPSLRHLGLIEGKWPETHKTADLAELVRSFTISTSTGMRAYGRIIAVLDAKGPKFMDAIRSLSPKSGEEELLRFLARGFGVVSENELRELRDRTKRWLTYLNYVELVTDSSGLKLNDAILRIDMSNKSLVLSRNEFVSLLSQKYREIRMGSPDLVYVPIPQIRDAVCQAKPGMLKEDFYDLLKETIGGKDLRILLSEPMTRQEGGMWMGQKYYYYISLYES